MGKFSHNKFHDSPSSGSRVVECGMMEGRRDVTIIIDAFHTFVNAHKSGAFDGRHISDE
jgi:hypothetical protein